MLSLPMFASLLLTTLVSTCVAQPPCPEPDCQAPDCPASRPIKYSVTTRASYDAFGCRMCPEFHCLPNDCDVKLGFCPQPRLLCFGGTNTYSDISFDYRGCPRDCPKLQCYCKGEGGVLGCPARQCSPGETFISINRPPLSNGCVIGGCSYADCLPEVCRGELAQCPQPYPVPACKPGLEYSDLKVVRKGTCLECPAQTCQPCFEQSLQCPETRCPEGQRVVEKAREYDARGCFVSQCPDSFCEADPALEPCPQPGCQAPAPCGPDFQPVTYPSYFERDCEGCPTTECIPRTCTPLGCNYYATPCKKLGHRVYVHVEKDQNGCITTCPSQTCCKELEDCPEPPSCPPSFSLARKPDALDAAGCPTCPEYSCIAPSCRDCSALAPPSCGNNEQLFFREQAYDQQKGCQPCPVGACVPDSCKLPEPATEGCPQIGCSPGFTVETTWNDDQGCPLACPRQTCVGCGLLECDAFACAGARKSVKIPGAYVTVRNGMICPTCPAFSCVNSSCPSDIICTNDGRLGTTLTPADCETDELFKVDYSTDSNGCGVCNAICAKECLTECPTIKCAAGEQALLEQSRDSYGCLICGTPKCLPQVCFDSPVTCAASPPPTCAPGETLQEERPNDSRGCPGCVTYRCITKQCPAVDCAAPPTCDDDAERTEIPQYIDGCTVCSLYHCQPKSCPADNKLCPDALVPTDLKMVECESPKQLRFDVSVDNDNCLTCGPLSLRCRMPCPTLDCPLKQCTDAQQLQLHPKVDENGCAVCPAQDCCAEMNCPLLMCKDSETLLQAKSDEKGCVTECSKCQTCPAVPESEAPECEEGFRAVTTMQEDSNGCITETTACEEKPECNTSLICLPCADNFIRAGQKEDAKGCLVKCGTCVEDVEGCNKDCSAQLCNDNESRDLQVSDAGCCVVACSPDNASNVMRVSLYTLGAFAAALLMM